MTNNIISRGFLITLLISVLFICYLIFQPFLTEIVAAAILVSVFYPPYLWLTKKLKGKSKSSSLIMCTLVAVLVIVPLANFIIYTAQSSVGAYEDLKVFVDDIGRSDKVSDLNYYYNETYQFVVNNEFVKSTLISVAEVMKEWLANGAGNLIVGTTNFIVSLLIIIFTMFFFFVDGEKMIAKVMYWTPLSNKYDKAIFKKFRDVSYSTMMSTLVTAILQGIIGAIGLAIVGVPVLFASIAMGFLALLPYLGAALVWFPIAVYLLATGQIWQGVFLLVWGAGVVSTADNLIRAYLIKGKAQVHPIFVIFSILGGIQLFGFWGVIFGPLIISLTVTVLHIFEMEYAQVLEK